METSVIVLHTQNSYMTSYNYYNGVLGTHTHKRKLAVVVSVHVSFLFFFGCYFGGVNQSHDILHHPIHMLSRAKNRHGHMFALRTHVDSVSNPLMLSLHFTKGGQP